MQLGCGQPMNIAMISYWTCPLTRWGELYAGGLNVYVVNLANNLACLGHRVDIYTRTHKEDEEKFLKVHEHVRVIHLASVSPNLYQDTEYFAEKTLRLIRKHTIPYDIIHSHFYYSGLAGLILKKKLFLPLVFTFHSLGVKELDIDNIYPERIEEEKKIVKRVDRIIVSTDFEKQDLIEYYQTQKEKIEVIYPGVEHKVFKNYQQNYCRRKLELPAKGKIILFVGRIDPNKGIGFLVESVAQLITKYSSFVNNLQVILIGGNIKSRNFWSHPEVKRLKKMIAEKGLDCCVKFIGSRPYHVLPYYYSAADVVVMPSVYESFGLVVLEAMACGGCVVASKVGGLKYLIKDKVNGRLFDGGNADQLCQILWELLNDKDQRDRLKKNAISESQHFSWDRTAKETIEVYKHLL